MRSMNARTQEKTRDDTPHICSPWPGSQATWPAHQTCTAVPGARFSVHMQMLQHTILRRMQTLQVLQEMHTVMHIAHEALAPAPLARSLRAMASACSLCIQQVCIWHAHACLCVCVYVYMRVCVYTYTRTHIHAHECADGPPPAQLTR